METIADLDKEPGPSRVLHVRPKRWRNGHLPSCEVHKAFAFPRLFPGTHRFRDPFDREQEKDRPSRMHIFGYNYWEHIGPVETSMARLLRCYCIACCIVLKAIEVFPEPEAVQVQESADKVSLYLHLRHSLYEISLQGRAVEMFIQDSKHGSGGRLLPYLPRGLGRIIPPDLASGHSVRQIQTWLDECMAFHECCKWNPDCVPTRLIDVGQDDQHIRLQETEHMHQSLRLGLRYTALSYCWGDGCSWTVTTSASIRNFTTQIPPVSIPATIMDAIIITRMLKIRYLWVDALCIIQDSPSDWARECKQMGKIYEKAILVLRAETALDANHGLFPRLKYRQTAAIELHAPRKKKSKKRKHRNFRPNRVKGNTVFIREAGTSGSNESEITHGMAVSQPIYTRGWVYQERFFGIRTVVFGSEEIGWECRSCQACECRVNCRMQPVEPIKALKSSPSHAATTESTVESTIGLPTYREWFWQWREHLEAFTKLRLTKDTDRLAAISGVASHFLEVRNATAPSATPEHYISGLWRSNISAELMWRTWGGTSLDHRVEGLPSWSWASVTAPINFSVFYDNLYGERNNKDVQWTLQDSGNPFGATSTARLSVESRLFPAILYPVHPIPFGDHRCEATFFKRLDPRQTIEDRSLPAQCDVRDGVSLHDSRTEADDDLAACRIPLILYPDEQAWNREKNIVHTYWYIWMASFAYYRDGSDRPCGLVLRRRADVAGPDVFARVGFWKSAKDVENGFFDRNARNKIGADQTSIFLQSQTKSLFHII